jgi:D-galactose 1-dehydrogenase
VTIRIGIIGYGKIARDQHVPSIAADPHFELAAVAGRRAMALTDVPAFSSHRELISSLAGELEAVAICTPPEVRAEIAADAIAAGLHVLLEKPPAATLGETEHMEALARKAGLSLYAGWHSQHAAAVPAARQALAGTRVTALDIQWFEDVRKWHPGQEWIWEPGGFGVFDPGINALSIATHILPMPLFVREASLAFPSNRQQPIAASLGFAGGGDAFRAEFDWRYTEGERWTIRVDTEEGQTIELLDGGARLLIGGEEQAVEEVGEYPSIYRRFAELIEAGETELDREPLRIVADAFLSGRRETVEPFE